MPGRDSVTFSLLVNMTLPSLHSLPDILPHSPEKGNTEKTHKSPATHSLPLVHMAQSEQDALVDEFVAADVELRRPAIHLRQQMEMTSLSGFLGNNFSMAGPSS